MTNHLKETKYYWFPAKKYGWGWGFPSAWQGWVVLFAYIGSLSVATYVFPPASKTALFVTSTLAISVLLFVACWIKGEPLKWRWQKI
ncbi:MAG: hypothetical protein PVH24_02515 [Candidatus Zixiibacteriota bacterium]